MRLIRLFINIIKQGLEGMWRNKGMGFASISSIAAVLLILGMVLIIVLSINNVVVDTKTIFDEIQIFFEDDITEEQLANLEKKIIDSDKIASYRFESREEALENYKKELEENADLLDGLDMTDALPNSFIISLVDIKYGDEVVKELAAMDGVYKVPYYQDVVDDLLKISSYIRLGGLAITLFLILISIFVISNTIKLTVASRKTEITIMKHVGATNGYIRGPFVVEGILFGLIGSLLAIVIVIYGYDYLYKLIIDDMTIGTTSYLTPPKMIVTDIIIIFSSIGIGIGILGSVVALKKYLKV